ncbi:ABC transporter substrate-binding protein [Nonomuraea sp. MTCD27]|uniref:ABC transporter substrate-binding protein n=1 Tax=Nonomuraea sp. MTCD27 TaxID=1676747 RepID=UPI0035BFA79F
MAHRKVLAALTAVSAGTLLLSACSSGEDGSGAGSGPVSLRMVLWSSNADQLAMFKEMGKQFAAANPTLVKDVQVTPTAAGESYRTVLTTQIGGGDAPDVGWLGSGDLVDFANQGALVDLAPTLKNDPGFDYADLTPAGMALDEDGDKVWGVPFSTSPGGIFYNADLFAEAGIPNPDKMIADGTWTWDNLARAAATIHEKTGATGFNIAAYKFDDNWPELNTIWAGYGAKPWNDTGDTCTFTEQPMQDSLQFLHDMIYKTGGYTKPGETPDFPTQQVAMSSTYISVAGTLKDVPFTWGLVPAPKGPKGAIASIGQSSIVAFAAGKHHDAAAKLVGFITNKENARKLARYFPPVRQSLLNTQTLAVANPVLTAEQLESVVIDGIKTGALAPAHADMGKIQTAARAELEKLWKPDADVKQVTQQICAAIDPLLKD